MKMSYNTYNLNKFGKHYLHHLMLDQNKIILELIYIYATIAQSFLKTIEKDLILGQKLIGYLIIKKTYEIHVC